MQDTTTPGSGPVVRPGTYRLSLISPIITEQFLVTSRKASAYRTDQVTAAEALGSKAGEAWAVLIPEAPHEAATDSRDGGARPIGWLDYGGKARTPHAFLRLMARQGHETFSNDGLTARCNARWYNIHDFGVLVFGWTFEVDVPDGVSPERLRAFADWLAESQLPGRVAAEAQDVCALIAKTLPKQIDTNVQDQIEHLDDDADWGFQPISVHRVWSFTPDTLPEGGIAALRPLFEVATLDGLNPAEVGPGALAWSGYMNSFVVAPEAGVERYSPEPLIAYYGYAYATMLLLDERLFFAAERFLNRTAQDSKGKWTGARARKLRERLRLFRDMTTFFLHRHHDELGVLKPFERQLWGQLMGSWRFEALARDLEQKREFLNEIYDQAAARAQERLQMLTNVVFGILTSLTLISVIGDFAWFFRDGTSGSSEIINTADMWRWAWAMGALGATVFGIVFVLFTRARRM